MNFSTQFSHRYGQTVSHENPFLIRLIKRFWYFYSYEFPRPKEVFTTHSKGKQGLDYEEMLRYAYQRAPLVEKLVHFSQQTDHKKQVKLHFLQGQKHVNELRKTMEFHSVRKLQREEKQWLTNWFWLASLINQTTVEYQEKGLSDEKLEAAVLSLLVTYADLLCVPLPLPQDCRQPR